MRVARARLPHDIGSNTILKHTSHLSVFVEPLVTASTWQLHVTVRGFARTSGLDSIPKSLGLVLRLNRNTRYVACNRMHKSEVLVPRGSSFFRFRIVASRRAEQGALRNTSLLAGVRVLCSALLYPCNHASVYVFFSSTMHCTRQLFAESSAADCNRSIHHRSSLLM